MALTDLTKFPVARAMPVAVVNASGVHVTSFGGGGGGSGEQTQAAASNVSSVGDSATSVTVLAANAARLGFSLYNDSTAIAYVKLGATASATSFTKKMLPQEQWGTRDLARNYVGIIDALWESDAGGSMRVTELEES